MDTPIKDKIEAMKGKETVHVAGDGTPLTELREIVHELCLQVIDGRLYLDVRFREETHLPPNAVNELSPEDIAEQIAGAVVNMMRNHDAYA